MFYYNIKNGRAACSSDLETTERERPNQQNGTFIVPDNLPFIDRRKHMTEKLEAPPQLVINSTPEQSRLRINLGKKKNSAHLPRVSKQVVLRADIHSKTVPERDGAGKKELIRDVQVEILKGDLVALLGGSGAGKTTVMNCLNGMDQRGVTGTVSFCGRDLYQNFDQIKWMIGSVPQQNELHTMLSVEEELKEAAVIRLPAETKSKEIKKRVNDTIHTLKLDAVRKSKISMLSGGEQKRVNIGIELVADRLLLCLDEPDAGLDPASKRELFTILRDLAHKRDKSVIVIIHDVAEIALFDKIIMMAKVDNVGRLAFSGSPQDAKRHFGVEDLRDAYTIIAQEPERFLSK